MISRFVVCASWTRIWCQLFITTHELILVFIPQVVVVCFSNFLKKSMACIALITGRNSWCCVCLAAFNVFHRSWANSWISLHELYHKSISAFQNSALHLNLQIPWQKIPKTVEEIGFIRACWLAWFYYSIKHLYISTTFIVSIVAFKFLVSLSRQCHADMCHLEVTFHGAT